MALLAVLAAVTALVVAGVALLALREARSATQAAIDEVRVLKVTVFGLEAFARPELVAARESADATLLAVDGLSKRLDEVILSPKARATTRSPLDQVNAFGRLGTVRQLFAQAEADSLSEVEKHG